MEFQLNAHLILSKFAYL